MDRWKGRAVAAVRGTGGEWQKGAALCRSNEVCQENDGRSPIKLTRVTGGAFAKWLCGASYITFIIPHLHFHISYLHFLFCYKSESLWLIRPSLKAGGATVKGRKRLIRPLFSVYTTLTVCVSPSLWVLLLLHCLFASLFAAAYYSAFREPAKRKHNHPVPTYQL